MGAPQIAGYAVTVAVVVLIDLPLGWLIAVAMLSGGFATLAVDTALRRRR